MIEGWVGKWFERTKAKMITFMLQMTTTIFYGNCKKYQNTEHSMVL